MVSLKFQVNQQFTSEHSRTADGVTEIIENLKMKQWPLHANFDGKHRNENEYQVVHVVGLPY